MGTTNDRLQNTMEFRRRGLLAAALYLITVMAVGGAMWGFVWNEDAQRPRVHPAEAAVQQPDGLPVIAGTGAALPLLHHLTRQWQRRGGQRIEVAASLGSSGGLAALRDRVIDCAIVSRPLAPDEEVGRVVVPLTMAPVVLAGGRGVAISQLSPQTLVKLVRHLGDGPGLVLREPGDSAQQLLAEAIPGLAEAYAEATASTAWPIAFTDAGMERMLLDRSNLIGVFDLGTIRLRKLPLRVVKINSTAEPFLRPFTLVCQKEHRLAGFLEFLTSGPVRDEMRSFGYEPEGN